MHCPHAIRYFLFYYLCQCTSHTLLMMFVTINMEPWGTCHQDKMGITKSLESSQWYVVSHHMGGRNTSYPCSTSTDTLTLQIVPATFVNECNGALPQAKMSHI